jgi:hypothetical protein
MFTMKHAYSWKYNSVVWQNTSKLNATGILAGLRKSQMANNYQVANDYMVSPTHVYYIHTRKAFHALFVVYEAL